MNGNYMLTELQLLAAMRHIVAHGALFPTNAVQWWLEGLYDPNRIEGAHVPPHGSTH
jgi:hypothetical protein